MTTKEEKRTELVRAVGEAILKFINPLVLSVEGHIPQGKNKGQLLVGYVGTLTEFAKEKIKEKEL